MKGRSLLRGFFFIFKRIVDISIDYDLAFCFSRFIPVDYSIRDIEIFEPLSEHIFDSLVL